jgi:hypothetical protein
MDLNLIRFFERSRYEHSIRHHFKNNFQTLKDIMMFYGEKGNDIYTTMVVYIFSKSLIKSFNIVEIVCVRANVRCGCVLACVRVRV